MELWVFSWPERFRTVVHLTRRFLLIGAISIGPAALLSGWVTGNYLTEILLQRERSVTASFIRDAIGRALPADAHPEHTLTAVALVGRMLLGLPEAVRVKVYDADGTIVWSDEPRLIGSNFKHDEHVQQGLAGVEVVTLERIEPTPEHAFEVGLYRDLTAIYVPILDAASGQVAMVFELYKLPDLFLTWIRRGRLMVWGMAIGTGGLLLAAQFALVRGAARTISRQHGDLEERARQLAAANADLRGAQRQLIESERLAAFGQATVAVAHGLRNPLANIRAVAQETLERMPAGDGRGRPLEDIVSQVDRLEARLRALLRSTHPLDLDPTVTSVDAILRGVVAALHARLAAAGVEVLTEVDPGTPALVCDPLQMEQALQEIVTNSAEAGARTVRLYAGAAADTGRVQFAVEDDGRGIDPAAAARAFEPMFTTKATGTGIGLAAVRRIVEAHGGCVSIATRPGGGTVVALDLPAAPPIEGAAG